MSAWSGLRVPQPYTDNSTKLTTPIPLLSSQRVIPLPEPQRSSLHPAHSAHPLIQYTKTIYLVKITISIDFINCDRGNAKMKNGGWEGGNISAVL